jgi:hypothetical protein
MKKRLRSVFFYLLPVTSFILFLLLFPAGCKNYNSEDLYPACDTTHVTYNKDIHPIVTANCLPCHTAVNQFGGIVLETYEGAIIPAQNGLLLKAVTHYPDPAIVPMPKGGAKLPSCDISKFRQWIAQGVPEQ